MKERLSIIDGLWSALPIHSMTEEKAREMLGDGPDPRAHATIDNLLELR